MKRAPAALGPCVRLVAAFPLPLAASALAAVAAELLLTLQPQLLRGFIDGAHAGLARRALWQFPGFMLAASVLAYAFDFLAVAIRHAVVRALERELKDAYLETADMARAEVVQYSLRSGIAKLSQLSLAVTLDAAIIVSRLAVVLFFLSLNYALLGLAAAAGVAAGAALTAFTTRRMGKASRALETVTGQGVRRALAHRLDSARLSADRAHALDERLFGLRSLNVALSWTLFRALPVGVIAWRLAGADVSLGALASIFLYFSMLRGPYLDLTGLIQDSIVSLSESGIFAEELARGLRAKRLLGGLPAGLVWDPGAARSGTPLSLAREVPARAYYDDVEGPEKTTALEALAARARREPVLVASADAALKRYAHFVRRPDGGLSTVLAAWR